MFVSLILLLVLLLQLMVCLRFEHSTKCVVFYAMHVSCVLFLCLFLSFSLYISSIMPFLHINLRGVIKMSNIHHVRLRNCIDSTLVFGRVDNINQCHCITLQCSVHKVFVFAVHRRVLKST